MRTYAVGDTGLFIKPEIDGDGEQTGLYMVADNMVRQTAGDVFDSPEDALAVVMHMTGDFTLELFDVI